MKIKQCKNCGKDFETKAPCHLYCSDVCKAAGKLAAYEAHLARLRSGIGSGGANKSGKNHPSYSSGKGFLNKNRHVFKALRKTCECCGKDLSEASGRNSFCIHHKDHNRRNNPEDFSNWELLCPRCHHNLHGKSSHLNVQRLAKA